MIIPVCGFCGVTFTKENSCFGVGFYGAYDEHVCPFVDCNVCGFRTLDPVEGAKFNAYLEAKLITKVPQ